MIRSRKLRWVGHLVRMEESRSSFKILKHKSTGKIFLGRARRTWEENIGMNLKAIGVNSRNWVDPAHTGIIGEPL